MTWLPVDGAGSEREQVFSLQPQTTTAFLGFLSTAEAVTDGALLVLCRTRIAQLLRCRGELALADPELLADLERWDTSPRFGQKERAALDFAEQFVTSAVDTTPQQAERLAHALGVREPSTFVYGLYINEGLVRLQSFFDIAPSATAAVLSSAGVAAAKQGLEFLDWVDEGSATDPRLLAAYHEFGRAACRQHGVDALTDEIVRLRSADMHDCKFCKSVRRNVALPEGVGDLMSEALAYQESELVGPRQKAALALLDGFVLSPWALSAEAQAEALEQFTPAQIVELMFKEVFWMSNKPMIALGTDPGAVAEDRLTDFEYDAEGNFNLLGAQV